VPHFSCALLKLEAQRVSRVPKPLPVIRWNRKNGRNFQDEL
jgi:hypothetical protein